MRSIWAGAISFGMVVIPVKLYAATEQRDVAFRQVHREDGGRIQFRRFCSLDGEEVPYSDVAKGYELATGDVVVLTDDDLKDLPLATAKRIDVLHFSPAGQLDPILANKAYYLEPEPAGVRAYVLFRDALERSGRVAVAKVAIRQREALGALRVRDGVLVLETLLWPDEVRAPDFKFLDEDVDIRTPGAEDGGVADRHDDRGLRPVAVQGRLPGGARGARPGQDRGQRGGPPGGHRGARGHGRAGPPTSPRRSARASRRPRRTGPRTRTADAAPPAPPKQRKPAARPQEGDRVTTPVPHWPGRMVTLARRRAGLAGGDAAAAERTAGRELVLCVHGMSGRGHQLDRPDGRARARLRLRGG